MGKFQEAFGVLRSRMGEKDDWYNGLQKARAEMEDSYWGKGDEVKGKSEAERREHDEKRRVAATRVMQILDEHPGPWKEVAAEAWETYSESDSDKRVGLCRGVIEKSGLDPQGRFLVETFVSASIINSIQAPQAQRV